MPTLDPPAADILEVLVVLEVLVEVLVVLEALPVSAVLAADRTGGAGPWGGICRRKRCFL